MQFYDTPRNLKPAISGDSAGEEASDSNSKDDAFATYDFPAGGGALPVKKYLNNKVEVTHENKQLSRFTRRSVAVS